MMWYPIHAINLSLLTLKVRSDLFFRLEIFKKVCGVCVMSVTIPHGIIWMVSGGIVSSMIALVINTYYTGKLINVGYLRQMGDLLPIFGISFFMWLVIHVLLWLTSNIYIQLPLGIFAGLLVYIVCARVLLKSQWEDAMSMLPARYKRKI